MLHVIYSVYVSFKLLKQAYNTFIIHMTEMKKKKLGKMGVNCEIRKSQKR